MQKSEPVTVINQKEKEILANLPASLSKTFKKHLEVLMEPFTNSPNLNARIKRIFNKPD